MSRQERTHPPQPAGRRDTGRIPVTLGGPVFQMMNRLLAADTGRGRRFVAKNAGKGTPLVRVRPGDLSRAGVERLPRVAAVRAGRPALEDGRVVDVANVIWCTGYAPGYSWITLPGFPATTTRVTARASPPASPDCISSACPTRPPWHPHWSAGLRQTPATPPGASPSGALHAPGKRPTPRYDAALDQAAHRRGLVVGAVDETGQVKQGEHTAGVKWGGPWGPPH